ncbi:DNA repair protein RadA [Candidatus Dojkabacteria bacterium]|nr:DNA repair protein RadA [Candidatus Dojkabacteria bacterium]
MKKDIYVCTECGAESLGWTGKCQACGAWGTLTPFSESESEGSGRLTADATKSTKAGARKATVKSVADVDLSTDIRTSSGFSEFDLVLGGGFVSASAVLLSGEPGIGKSTLALASLLSQKGGGYYVTAEESLTQVAKRIERIAGKKLPEDVKLVEGRSVEEIISKIKPKTGQLVVWDSLQALSSDESTGIPGGVSQSRIVCSKIVQATREKGIISVIVGQVTKDGFTAGPKLVEHMVDAVLYLESLPNSTVRVLRAAKNRFGSTMEVGLLEMKESGFSDIDNTFNIFAAVGENTAGSVMASILEGSRVLAVEVQGLVVESVYQMPRRMAHGITKQRLEIIVAVLSKVLRLPLGKYDIFVNIAGGLFVKEPYIDLATAVAIISSLKGKIIPKDAIFSGEISLSGIVRAPDMLSKRVNAMKKIGYKKFYTSAYADIKVTKGSTKSPAGVIGLKNLKELLRAGA